MKNKSKVSASRAVAKTVRSRPGAHSKEAPAPARPVVPLKERRLNFGNKWDYAPAADSVEHLRLAPRHELFIDGKSVPPASGKYFDAIDPASERKLSEVALGGEPDLNLAIQAAQRAADQVWSQLPAAERGKYLYRIARLIQEKTHELAPLETLDSGKPVKETRGIDLPLVAAHFFYYAGWADKLAYAFPGRTPQPLGVVGQILPWHSPLMTAAWRIAPALACGNTVVIQPSEFTSLSLLRLVQIFQEAGLPEGVVNVVTGGAEVSTAMARHPDIHLLAFSGSTQVGKQLALLAAGTGKRLAFQLGGQAANILFEDAPLDQAIEGLVAAVYLSQSHVSGGGCRLFIQENIFPHVVRKLRDRLQTLRVGNPLDKNTDIGPLNHRAQVKQIAELVQDSIENGAEVIQPRCTLPGRGFWYPPTFLTGVTAAHRLVQEECSGPVLALMTFRTPEEAVERANNTPYGSSVGVWTDKGSKSFKIASKLRAGVVWANTFNKFDPTSPFGGYKESGFGREGGLQGLMGYVRL